MTMDYREKVMAYANVIQVFSEDRADIVSALEAKVNAVDTTDDRHEFWSEVMGRVYRNCYFTEIHEIIHLEKKHGATLDAAPSTTTIVNSPNILKWISLLPKFQEEVDFLLDYQKDNHILEKATNEQAFNACIGSLQFFNDALVNQKSLEELFKYIPLMTWSIESLLITKQLNPQFLDFLKTSFIPLLRAHRAAVLVFLDLVENEEIYLNEAKSTGSQLTKSSIFNRDYQPEKINLYIPPEHTSTDSADPYLDALSYTLLDGSNQKRISGYRFEQVKKAWFFTPLSQLYKLRLHSDMLGVTNSYTPVMSPKLLNVAYNRVYAHIKCYDERNLLESSILGIENIIMDFQKNPYKEIYAVKFSEAFEYLKENLDDMLRLGLITHEGKIETIKRIQLRGEVYGIY